MNSSLAQREHARLGAHRLALRAARAAHLRRDLLQVDSAHQVHLPRVNLQDVHPRVLRGVGELDLTIDAPGTEQRRVQNVQSVRRHDHLDLVARLEPVQLVQQLQHGALHLGVAAAAASRAADGVHLVHEQDRRSVLSRHHEELAHHPRALADVLLHELRSGDADEATVGVMRHRTRQEGLARAGRTVQDHALGLRDAEGFEKLRVLDGQLHHLLDLLHLLVETADHVEGAVGHLLHLRRTGGIDEEGGWAVRCLEGTARVLAGE